MPAVQLWMTAFGLLLTAHAAENLSPPCNEDQIEAVCEKLKTLNDTDSIELDNGSRIPGCLLATATHAAGPRRTVTYDSKSKIVLTQIFTRSKELLSEQILQARKEANLSVEEKSLLERIRTVSPKIEDMRSSDCAPISTASYRSADHTVPINPQILNFPLDNSLRIFGHEISHSIGHCGNKSPLYRKQDGSYNLGDSSVGASVAGSSFDFSRHPLQTAFACLSSPNGSAFIFEPPKERGMNRQTTPDQSGRKHAIDCSNAEIYEDEAFSDLLGTNIVTANFSKPAIPYPQPKYNFTLKPPRYKISAEMGSILFQLDQVCSASQDKNNHPPAKKRYLEITLRNPQMAKSLNCPQRGATCLGSIERLQGRRTLLKSIGSAGSQ